MVDWNLNPAWTELQDIVRQQVTSTTGITDEMFNSLMENVQYCKNNLGMSDVRVGSVITNTLEPGNLASVSCTERLVDNYTYLDFVFNIPRGKDGMGTYINGEPTPVYFTSNPQSQINDLKQQNTSQSSQIENLGQADQNLQSQINDLKQLRIERISVWKRKTIEEGKVLSVNSNQFNMKTASYWGNCLLFELRMCCFSGGGLNEPTTTYFVSRPTSGNAERIPCTCGANAQELGVFSPTIYSDAIIIYNYTPYPIYLDEVFVWIQK